MIIMLIFLGVGSGSGQFENCEFWSEDQEYKTNTSGYGSASLRLALGTMFIVIKLDKIQARMNINAYVLLVCFQEYDDMNKDVFFLKYAQEDFFTWNIKMDKTSWTYST